MLWNGHSDKNKATQKFNRRNILPMKNSRSTVFDTNHDVLYCWHPSKNLRYPKSISMKEQVKIMYIWLMKKVLKQNLGN